MAVKRSADLQILLCLVLLRTHLGFAAMDIPAHPGSAHLLVSRVDNQATDNESNEELVEVLQGINQARQMFGFVWPSPDNFKHYNWSLLTTVAWVDDPEVVCLAHSHQTRVVKNALNISQGMAGKKERVAWVIETVQHVLDHSLDGVNFDYESPTELWSHESHLYARLVQLTADALHTASPNLQVSVDVPWSPYGVDDRYYDWQAMARAADLMFIMSYDTQSQIWGRCVGSANSPLALVRRGVKQWLGLGIPASKLVLGLPWYGYSYPCESDRDGHPAPPDVDVCHLNPVEFQGALCSDAAGAQWPYAYIKQWIHQGRNTTPLIWEPVQAAYTFNYMDDGKVWFDTPESLLLRYRLASDLGLRGVGCWNLEHLYTSPPPPAPGSNATRHQEEEEAKAMWQAVQEGFFQTTQ